MTALISHYLRISDILRYICVDRIFAFHYPQWLSYAQASLVYRHVTPHIFDADTPVLCIAHARLRFTTPLYSNTMRSRTMSGIQIASRGLSNLCIDASFRMESFNQENGDLRRKLDSLEDNNQSLMEQLRALQMLVAEKLPKQTNTVTTQTSSCLMVRNEIVSIVWVFLTLGLMQTVEYYSMLLIFWPHINVLGSFVLIRRMPFGSFSRDSL